MRVLVAGEAQPDDAALHVHGQLEWVKVKSGGVGNCVVPLEVTGITR